MIKAVAWRRSHRRLGSARKTISSNWANSYSLWRNTMHAKWMTFVLTTALVATGSLFAQQKHQSTMAGQNMQNSADRSFISSAAEANLAEIDMAKMVSQKSTDPAVKDFANRMVTDHTQASQKLASVAEMNGVKLPTEETATERNKKTELQKLSGTQLNDAYLRDELQGHKEAISAFESEIEHGQNQEAKNYAEQTLPTLQDHIRIAEDVAGKLGLAGKTGLSDETKAITAK
jgi:putative membrane protein